MEFLSHKKRNALVASTLSLTALAGCSIDSYPTDPANVKCDERRTETDLKGDGIATFIVHGKHTGDIASVRVRRIGQQASVNVTGDVTGPPQQREADGFSPPMPIGNGAELSAFGAGGAWIIDVRKSSVVIQGTCDGM